jgi:hypothetical protein
MISESGLVTIGHRLRSGSLVSKLSLDGYIFSLPDEGGPTLAEAFSFTAFEWLQVNRILRSLTLPSCR